MAMHRPLNRCRAGLVHTDMHDHGLHDEFWLSAPPATRCTQIAVVDAHPAELYAARYERLAVKMAIRVGGISGFAEHRQ